MLRKISPAIFGTAIICFFLPFVSITCQNQKIASVTGINLVTGTTINKPMPSGSGEGKRIGVEPLAIFALTAGAAGLALGLSGMKQKMIGTVFSGAAGVVLLVLLRMKLNHDVSEQTKGLASLDYEAGYYLVFFLYLAAFVVGLAAAAEGRGRVSAAGPGPGTERFCTQCGAGLPPDARFCGSCGARIS